VSKVPRWLSLQGVTDDHHAEDDHDQDDKSMGWSAGVVASLIDWFEGTI
jgi:hypothetical protein